MIGGLVKFIFYFVIILIIFAILPKSFLEKIKPFFNWQTFKNLLKTGFYNFVNFLKEIGLDFNQFNEKIKFVLGVDLLTVLERTKIFLADLLIKIAEVLR